MTKDSEITSTISDLPLKLALLAGYIQENTKYRVFKHSETAMRVADTEERHAAERHFGCFIVIDRPNTTKVSVCSLIGDIDIASPDSFPMILAIICHCKRGERTSMRKCENCPGR